VASRNLGDPNFAKTVILLVRYDAQGALGFILNRRTDVPLSRALETIKAAKDRSDRVYLGGPMEMPAVFALFQSPAKLEGAESIFDGVYLITAKPLFEQTISARPTREFSMFISAMPDGLKINCGRKWTGRLVCFPAAASEVFNSEPDSLWDEMIRKTELQMARSETTCR